MSEALDCIQPGDRAGPYCILRRFPGRSGMAAVFEVNVRQKYRQPGLPHRLALKVAREEYQAALVAEADFLSRFDNPNVVRIFPLPGYHRPVYAAREQFRFGWGWYYAMELLDGGSLERHLTRRSTVTDLFRPTAGEERRLNLLETLGIARQMAAALQHIHERSVINLDVKPGNVLFRRRNFKFLRASVPQVVLCDFGIARDLRYLRAGLLGVATPEYASPEQALESNPHAQPVDARSDIFSLGIVIYEMLAGSLPFDSVGRVVDLAYTPPPIRQLRPSIPPLLEKIVMQALAKEPAYRFRSANEMRAALEQVPTPPDWGTAARRTFAGIALTTALAASGWGIRSRLVLPTPTPTAAPPATVEMMPTATNLPTIVPETRRPTDTVPAGLPTSTPAPTYTPTFTPRPLTPTPTSGG